MNGLNDHMFNIRLCKAVKKFPVLYDTDLKEYASRDARERAWIEVGIDLNCEHKDLQRKWKNLRTIYLKNIKQLRRGETKHQYYLYPYIKFLDPFLKTTHELEEMSSTSKTDFCTEYEEIHDYETDADNVMHDIEYNDEIYCEEDDRDDDNDDEIELNIHKRKKRDSLESLEDDTSIEYDGYSKQKTNQHNFKHTFHNKAVTKHTSSYDNITPSTDHLKHTRYLADNDNPKKQFLLSLLPDIDLMTDKQMRQLKIKVLMLVEDILKDNVT